jgi:hypothetical protein
VGTIVVILGKNRFYCPNDEAKRKENYENTAECIRVQQEDVASVDPARLDNNATRFRPGSSEAGPTLDQSLVAGGRLVNPTLCIVAGVLPFWNLLMLVVYLEEWSIGKVFFYCLILKCCGRTMV